MAASLEVVKQYAWKEGSHPPTVDAEVAAKELEVIRKKRGSLTPRHIVESARDPLSPIHEAFEWDDNEAAESWRDEQARHMVRCIIVKVRRTGDPDGKVINLRRYASMPIEDDGREYRPIDEVMAHPSSRVYLREQALREAESFRMKYQQIHELGEIFTAVEKVRAQYPAIKEPRARRTRVLKPLGDSGE